MKNLKFASTTILLVLVIYQIPNVIEWFFNYHRFRHIQVNSRLIEGICDAFGIFIVIFFLLSITYKKYWNQQTFNHIISAVSFSALFLFVFLSLKEIYTDFRSIDKLYAYYKKNIGILGDVFTADDTLGHRGIPNGSGVSVYPLGNREVSVPIRLDEEGFRIPKKAKYIDSDTLMLFLGCSFTWGDYSLAEENYPTQAVDLLKFKSLNCGTDAYGLAQMLILAERKISKHHPKIVSVQYSPWLADRARFIFFPSAYGVMPFPFITKDSELKFYIHQPFFRSSLYNPGYKYFKISPKSFSDKFLFFFKVGIPVAVIDSWKQRIAQWKMVLGILPTAESDNLKIEKFVYERIYEICKQNGAKLVVLNLGGYGHSNEQRMSNHYNRKYFNKTMNSEMVKNVTFIDADSALRAEIKPNENYSKYVQWGKINKTDSVIYDLHPNPMAHRIIAKILVEGIKKSIF